MSTYAAVSQPYAHARGKERHIVGFVALTLAGVCPLCGAERLEDGAPAPRECLYAAEGSEQGSEP